ncbi:CshA/CshB family fibrillar adhesin-related protein [Clostridium butyricum]|uniref:CshA/CshB family fibrillar adhesin-related protein n=1 Tax=Clostridium butyricum TaxID=1492 RepID=UPI00374E4E1F
MSLNVKYAEKGSKGALAGLIGWIDYGTVMNLSPGQSTRVVNTIAGGYTISFDLSLVQTYTGQTTSATPISFKGFTTPVLSSGGVAFGNTGYTGIDGNVALYMSTESDLGVDTISKLTLNNILVLDSSQNPVSKFSIIVADAESTNKVETWSATTNGTAWALIDVLPAPNGSTIGGPIISGVGTNTVNETGVNVNMGNVSGPVYFTQRPTQVVLGCLAEDSRQGFVVGVIINQDCNCNLDINKNDKIVNICPGRTQYFKFVVSPSCGEYTIVYTGSNYNPETGIITGSLATYQLTEQGIIVYVKGNLTSGAVEVLPFEIISQCGVTKFEIVFAYNPSECSSNTNLTNCSGCN